VKVFVIMHSHIEACPIHSMHPEHYHSDGTCECVRPTEPA
jgi:hypothetical protein